MKPFRSNLWPGARTVIIRYGSALSVVALTILLRLWLDPLIGRTGFAIFLTGMLVTAWVGGLGPCLIGQTLILFAEAVWFSPTHNPPSPLTLQGIVSLVAFYSVGSIVAVLSEAWQAARVRALIQRDEAISQREQLRATFSCMGDGVLVTDFEGRLSMMNPVAEAMTGWTLAESQGKPIRDVFAIYDEQTRETIESPVPRVLRHGSVLHESMRFILTTRNDRQVPVSFSAAPIHGAGGGITGVVLVFRDETERRRNESALREADRRKDDFLATLAHELRNPLAPICMGLELMKISEDDWESMNEVRAMMERQTQHMVRLIDDLLDVSRITRGKLELRRCQVELADVIRTAVDATRPMIEEAEQQLYVKLPDSPILFYADPNRITQVLSNLLNNASKYTPTRGHIELEAKQIEGEITVTVSDNGLGIPVDMHEAIFEMFTQVRGAMESGHQGLGIGLTLVKRLVEMHGGTVEVNSGGRGLGSEFHIRLPAMPSLPTEHLPLPSFGRAPAATLRRRVLVVDDNEDALKTLSLLVRVLGNDVYHARNGSEAVEATQRFEPDVVLMDIGMPKLNGYEAARRIRQEPWGLDVVLIATTGWGQDEDRRRTKEAGFDEHLVKPIDPNRLKELLANLAPRRLPERPPSESQRLEPAHNSVVSAGVGEGCWSENGAASSGNELD